MRERLEGLLFMFALILMLFACVILAGLLSFN